MTAAPSEAHARADIGSFSALADTVAILPRVRAAIVEATEVNVIQGAIDAFEAGVIEPMFFGEPTAVAAAVSQVPGAEVFRVVDTAHARSATDAAIDAFEAGKVDILSKGHLHTDAFLHPVLKKLRTAQRLSHVFVADLDTYPKLLTITDGAINIAPTLQAKVEILDNAIGFARLLRTGQPCVAVLSAAETVNVDMPSTIDAACLAKMADRGQIPGAIVDGPLAFDVAISAAAAEIKGLRSPVAGKVDIVLVPDVVSGNILAKDLAYLAGATLAGLVLGALVPIVLTSRADPADARLASFEAAALLYHCGDSGNTP